VIYLLSLSYYVLCYSSQSTLPKHLCGLYTSFLADGLCGGGTNTYWVFIFSGWLYELL